MYNNRGNYLFAATKNLLTQREKPDWINKTIPKNDHNMTN